MDTGQGRSPFPKEPRILAVDDSETYLAALRRDLAGEPYVLVTADSASDAFRLLDRDRFDCVLVDLVMPGIDGVAFCQRLSERRGLDAPAPMVLVLTGSETEDLLPRALEAGAEDFVSKNADSEVLRTRIRLLLRRRAGELVRRRVSARLRDARRDAVVAELGAEAARARAGLLEELQRNHASLDQFARLAAHDLKAPLRTFVSLGQLLLRRDELQRDRELERAVSDIVSLATRMAETLEDVLEYVRLPAESATEARTDLRLVLEEALESLHDEIERSSVVVETEVLPVVGGEPPLLFRALRRVLDEALQDSSGGGRVIHVSARRKGGSWWIRFSREGGTIDEEHVDTRARPPDVQGMEGHGESCMSLAICRKIVEVGGGEFLVERGPDGSSRLCLVLPAEEGIAHDQPIRS